MEIDLRKYWLPLIADVRKGLRTFQVANPDTEVSAVGLFGDGFHGSVSLHADTAAHSTEFVRRYARGGNVLEDEAGQFCGNCPDFEYCIGEFRLAGYPDPYERDRSAGVTFISVDGIAELVNEGGDTCKHQQVFPFLKKLIATFEPFSGLSRCSPFRVGVQMVDNQHEFWLVHAGAHHEPSKRL